MTKRITYHISFWIAYVLFKAYLNYDSGSFVIEGKAGPALFFRHTDTTGVCDCKNPFGV